VTPWRSLISGFSVTLGRRGRSFEAIHRFMLEIVACSDPYAMVVGRIRDGERLPGFDSDTVATVHQTGDPRMRAIFEFCSVIFAKDPAFARVKAVTAAIKEIKNVVPSFAFMAVFVGWKIGLSHQDSLFSSGDARPAGLRTQSNNIKPERPIVSLRPTKELFPFDGSSRGLPPVRQGSGQIAAGARGEDVVAGAAD